MKGWSVIRQGVIGPTSFQFEKASPFRPRIARGQCDAIATGRYIYISSRMEDHEFAGSPDKGPRYS